MIWAVLDPANPFIAPQSAPFVIGLAYANMIWGFANVTISTNLARDLGTRMVAAIFFGGDAFNRYAPIAILVNIPATIFATAVYEIIQRDSFAIIAKGHNVSIVQSGLAYGGHTCFQAWIIAKANRLLFASQPCFNPRYTIVKQ